MNEQARKRNWGTVLPIVLLSLIGFGVAYQFVDPAPPSHFVLSSGSAGGAYQGFAEQYRQQLARHGVELEVLPSKGSLENIRRLQSGQADAALVQGGVAENDRLLSLGNLYYEPLWVFHRAGLALDKLADLRGRRLAVGPEGSGTRPLVLRLLADNGIDGQVETRPLGGQAAADALLAGEVDAAFFVASPESAVVRGLLQSDKVELLSFERAEAYTRRLRYLSAVTLPRGMVDIAADLPAAPKTLLAARAEMVISPDLHPALQDILLQTIDTVHRDGGWFERPGEFPNATRTQFPISPEAERFHKYGPPFLQRYMPFWAATLIDRLKVMLLPLIVLIIPLAKIMPPIYTWRMRSRIYRWYQELEEVELAAARNAIEAQQLLARLSDIEREVVQLHVPLSFASQLYDLRQHIELVKRRLSA